MNPRRVANPFVPGRGHIMSATFWSQGEKLGRRFEAGS